VLLRVSHTGVPRVGISGVESFAVVPPGLLRFDVAFGNSEPEDIRWVPRCSPRHRAGKLPEARWKNRNLGHHLGDFGERAGMVTDPHALHHVTFG
jgi:hypothetical protein